MAGATATWDPTAGDPGAPTTDASVFGISQAVGDYQVVTRRDGAGMSQDPQGRQGATESVQQQLSRFYEAPPEQLSGLKAALYGGGFYSSSYYSGKNPKPIQGGHDEDTYAAFKTAVIRAARSGMTLDEVLAEANTGAPTGSANGGTVIPGRVGGANVYTATSSDPAEVKLIADKVAQQLLGRKLKAGERDQLVQTITAAQLQHQGAVNNAREAASKAQYSAQQSQDVANATAQQTGSAPLAASGSAVDIITQTAQQLGVDPKLALAIAQQESGLNPNSIGDGGHSVGLFQLNDRGEGAGMSVAQRQDAATNARIALTQVAAVAKLHPDWSPGEIAAAAQRPADRSGYAKSVNSLYGTPGASVAQAGATQVPGTYIPATTITQADVNPQADLEQQIRSAHPVEAAAHDSTQVYSTMLGLIKGTG